MEKSKSLTLCEICKKKMSKSELKDKYYLDDMRVCWACFENAQTQI